MSHPDARAHSTRALEEIGIDEMEERAYRTLLMRRMATADEIAHTLALPERKMQRLLDRIEAKGLATRSLERPRRYIATAPDIAIEALVHQRQEALERARATIAELKEQSVTAQRPGETEQLVELLTSRDAVAQVFAQLLETVQSEVVALQRAPVLLSSFDQTEDPQRHAIGKALRTNVRLRAITDVEFLALPGAVDRIRLDIEAGEDVRIFPALPFKMVVFDRRIGLIPLNLQEPEGPSLLLRSSALLDALYGLFEILWERSTPIAFSRTGVPVATTGEPDLPKMADKLIPLLASGLNDKAIAHELRLSASTLARRIADLMKALDTRTRFQMGWAAALKAFPERVEAADRARSGMRAMSMQD